MGDVLIEMLYGDTLIGVLRVRKITSRDHALYVECLIALGRRPLYVNQMKGKLLMPKMMQRLFTDLMSQTGMGGDLNTKMVIGSDEHWANAIRVRKMLPFI